MKNGYFNLYWTSPAWALVFPIWVDILFWKKGNFLSAPNQGVASFPSPFCVCCSSIREIEPYMSLERIMFQDSKKHVCVTSSHAESKTQLTQFLILPPGYVHVVFEYRVALRSLGIGYLNEIQDETAYFLGSKESFRNSTTNFYGAPEVCKTQGCLWVDEGYSSVLQKPSRKKGQ